MNYKVLVADDESIMQKAMQTLISWEEIGCELVYVASNGIEVKDYLKKEIPDIMVLDIRIPGVDGIALAKYVYEEKIPTKVILLTAYADFEYAQRAVKYDVIDYVIKTGAFDELLEAIEKAKNKIRESQVKKNHQYKNMLKENFFKAIFDGTLYLQEEISDKAEECGIKNKDLWTIVSIRFQVKENRKREYVYQSLLRFVEMVFDKQMIHGMPVGKNEMVVVLGAEVKNIDKLLQIKCEQIVDMMENFMRMDIYIGISNESSNLLGLKNAYEEAENAVSEGYFYKSKKINFYKELNGDFFFIRDGIDVQLKELYLNMKKGMEQESIEAFEKMLDYFRTESVPIHVVQDIGIEIQSMGKRILVAQNKSVHEQSGGLDIYKCKHIDEYKEIILEIIMRTVQYTQITMSKKNILIEEVEKYIEDNLQKNITVSEIARKVGVSLSYLSRVYKEETGNTLIHLINQKKIEKAKEYLESTELKIYEIAEILGFENSTYFSFFFKKNTGLSPKEYKEEKKHS